MGLCPSWQLAARTCSGLGAPPSRRAPPCEPAGPHFVLRSESCEWSMLGGAAYAVTGHSVRLRHQSRDAWSARTERAAVQYDARRAEWGGLSALCV